jgi:hypothetical protein
MRSAWGGKAHQRRGIRSLLSSDRREEDYTGVIVSIAKSRTTEPDRAGIGSHNV